MERCGTHSAVNIIKNACKVASHVVHEEPPYLCKEAQLIFQNKEFRTKDLKNKVKQLRKYHKTSQIVCEANHRFGYLATFLMKEFAPDCKVIFLIRDPVATIISRISIWAHYPDFLRLYPDFYKQKILELTTPEDFNRYRICPGSGSLIDLYLWEWIENYKFTRRELACLPMNSRLIMHTENLTHHFDKLLGFIGMEYFKVDDSVMGWARVKSDSVYAQPKEKETDVFVTQNRDLTDPTIIFAKNLVNNSLGKIQNTILEHMNFVDGDPDLRDMDEYVKQFFMVKMI